MERFGSYRFETVVSELWKGREDGFLACMKNLNEIMMLSGGSEDSDGAIGAFLEDLCQVFGGTYACVFERRACGTYEPAYAARYLAEETAEEEDQERTFLNLVKDQAEDLSADVLSEWDRVFLAQDGYLVQSGAEYASAHPSLRETFEEGDVRNLVAVPIYLEGDLLGFLSLTNLEEDRLLFAAALLPNAASHLGPRIRFARNKGKVEELKRYDAATGLLSRSLFEQSLTQFLNELRQGNRRGKWDIIGFNIHNFKIFNAQNGFLAGNELLRSLADTLRSLLPNLFATRSSADHFYLLVEDDQAEEVVRRVHQCMLEKGKDSAIVYAGIYTITGEETESTILLDRAKLATDAARGDMHIFYCRYDANMEEQLKLESYLVTHIDEAIEKGWIKVYYQPIMATLSRKITNLEALSRWIDPTFGFLNPGQFINVLEHYRILYKLDFYVIEEACKRIRQAMDAGHVFPRVTVNLSRHDLQLPDLHERIGGILEQYQVPHDYIHLEVTESAMISNETIIKDHIERFHKDGYEVWLDDFGSGYSSLNTLQDYDFDCVKIDMFFLQHGNARTPTMMRSIVDMAKQLGMLTLTEGVETQEQLDFLREIGCSLAQGYLLSKPDLPENLIKNEKLIRHGVETEKEHVFYRRISRVNVLNMVNPVGSSSAGSRLPARLPSAILKLDEIGTEFLYANEEFRDFLTEVTGRAWDQIRVAGPLWEGRIFEVVRQSAAKARRQKKPIGYSFVLSKKSGRMVIEYITDYMGQCAYYLRITELESYRHARSKRLNSVQNLYTMFEEVGEIYPEEGRFEHVYGELEEEADLSDLSLDRTISLFAQSYVHPSEREAYLDFMNPVLMKDRIDASPSHSLNSFFHFKGIGGDYKWKRVILGEEASGGVRHYLYAVTANLAGWDPVRLSKADREGNLPEDLWTRETGCGPLREDVLWNALTGLEFIGMFWKDADRRFVGANEAFLSYYGMTLENLLGKNDEEIGWHPNPEPFKKDEERVLREGAVIENAVGECIVKGEVRRIMATKFPVRFRGKIIGLVGYFMDISNVTALSSEYDCKTDLDQRTGLLNMNGLVHALEGAERAYQAGHGDFGVITVRLPGLLKFQDDYGAEEYMHLLQEIAGKIRGAVPDATISHPSGSHFILLVQRSSDETLRMDQEMIRQSLTSLHRIGRDMPVTLYARIGRGMYSAHRDLSDLVVAAEGMAEAVEVLS